MAKFPRGEKKKKAAKGERGGEGRRGRAEGAGGGGTQNGAGVSLGLPWPRWKRLAAGGGGCAAAAAGQAAAAASGVAAAAANSPFSPSSFSKRENERRGRKVESGEVESRGPAPSHSAAAFLAGFCAGAAARGADRTGDTFCPAPPAERKKEREEHISIFQIVPPPPELSSVDLVSKALFIVAERKTTIRCKSFNSGWRSSFEIRRRLFCRENLFLFAIR